MHACRAVYDILRVMNAMFDALCCCMYCMYCMLLLPLVIPNKNANRRRGTHTRNTIAPGPYNSEALIEVIVLCRLLLCYCMRIYICTPTLTPLHTHTHTRTHARTRAYTHTRARVHKTIYKENKTCHRDGKMLDLILIFRNIRICRACLND